MTTYVALVGGGHIHTPGFVKRLNERAGVAVKYVWDHDPARAQKRAEALNAPVVSDLAQVWKDPEVAAAIVCSETNRHEGLVLAGAAAGKHLFVEKPLGMGAVDSNRMADAIEKAGVIFQTGYFNRGNPIYRFLRAELAAGRFGKVTRLRMSNCHSGSLGGWFDTEWRWMADPAIAGCGAFGDLGTHHLDIMLWLLGDVTRVTADIQVATRRYGDCDEYGEGLLHFASGASGVLAGGWVDVANPITLEMSGTQAHASVVNGQLFYKAEAVPGADGKTPWTGLAEPLPHAFDLFMDAITGTPGLPLVTVREAAYRSAVMEALYKGARQQAWINL